MAKVVGRDESAVKRITHKDCAAIIEYTENEVTAVRYTDYGSGASVQGQLTCPNCGKTIIVYDR